MHLCLTVECITSVLHLPVFLIRSPPPLPPIMVLIPECDVLQPLHVVLSGGGGQQEEQGRQEGGPQEGGPKGHQAPGQGRRRGDEEPENARQGFGMPFVVGEGGRRQDVPSLRSVCGTVWGGLRERGNDTSKSTGRSGRQNAATRPGGGEKCDSHFFAFSAFFFAFSGQVP